MLKTQIKASQITNLTDARYFAAWGVEWIGFDLEEGSATYVPPTSLLGIRDWIEGPKIIGEYALQDPATILTTVKDLGLDGIQLGPFFPVDDLKTLAPLIVIQRVVIEADTDAVNLATFFQERAATVHHFLLDFSANGISWNDLKNNKVQVTIDDIKSWAASYSLLANVQFPPDQYEDLLALGIKGFSVKGGEEEKVGLKSFDELDKLFEAIAID